MISGVNEYLNENNENSCIAYIENDLTSREIAVLEEAKKWHAKHPEDLVSLDDAMAELGVTHGDLDRFPRTKFTYSLK